MASNGQIVIDVTLNNGDVVQGVADIQDQLNGLGDNGSNQTSKLGKAFKGLVGAATIATGAVVGIGAAVGGLAAPLVQAAASAQAMQAQFDQVFSELKGQAQTTVEALGSNFGMMPERIKPAFTQMTSMFKGLGLDTQAAMGQAEVAVTAVADAAAFYDLSFEDANSALNSFIKGNYEGGEAIGLFASETQMAAYAVKDGLIGATKEWANLDEATKQATRLEYAVAMQNMAGATGQASRESDSLENQLGNLKAAWEKLKALVGAPLLEPAIQGIKLLTSLIQNFDVTPFTNAFDALKTTVIPLIMSFIDQIRNIFTNDLGGTFAMAQTYLATLREFWETDGQALLDRAIGIFNNLRDMVLPVIQEAVTFINGKLQELKAFWDAEGQQYLDAISNVFNGILAVVEFCMPAVQFVIDYVWTAIKNVITGALDVIMGAVKIFSGLFTGDFDKMWEGVKQLFSGAIDLILGWMSLTFVGGIRTLLVNFGKSSITVIKGMWDDIAKAFTTGIQAGKTAVYNFIKNIITHFKNLFTNTHATFTNMSTTVVNTLKTMATNAINAVKSLPAKFLQIGKDVVEGFIKGITDMADRAAAAIGSVMDGVIDKAASILGWASPAKEFIAMGKDSIKGYIIGLEKEQKSAETAMQGVLGSVIKVARASSNELAKIEKEQATALAKIETDKQYKINQIHLSNKNKKKVNTAAVNAKIEKIEQDSATKKVATEQKYATQIAKINDNLAKEKLEAVKAYIDDKKSLDQLSLKDEIAIWKRSLSEFKKGTTQRIKAQQEYSKAVDQLNNEVASVNETYTKRMQDINKNFADEESKITQEYEKALEDRTRALTNFAGLFELFDIQIETSGTQLLDNLKSQVDGFKDWQLEITKLSERAIDDGLLAELRAMGPDALGELKALNSLTDEQLTEYSGLYQEKSQLAREQAEKELSGMKTDMETNIGLMRDSAKTELSELQTEWADEIRGIVNVTQTELSSLEQIGRDAVAGLKNGISSMHSDLKDTASEVAGSIEKVTREVLDTHSPSKAMYDVGTDAMAGLINAVSDSAVTLQQTVENVVESLPEIDMATWFADDVKALEELKKQADALAFFVDYMSPEKVSTEAEEKRIKLAEKHVNLLYEKNEEYAQTLAHMKEMYATEQEALDRTNQIIESKYAFDGRYTEYYQELLAINVAEQTSLTAHGEFLRDSLEYDKKYHEAKFALEKKYIEKSLSENSLSLMQEMQLYEKFAKDYEKNTEQRTYYDERIEKLKKEIYDDLIDLNDEYTDKIRKANEDLASDLIDIEEDYAKKSSDLKQDAINREQELTAAYEDALASRKQALTDFVGLFDKVEKKEGITGKRLMNNLQSQVNTFKRWQQNLNSLSSKGIDQGLLKELQAMGPEAATEIAALNTLTKAELNQYTDLWREKSQLASTQATSELAGMKDDTQAQIAEIHANTATQLSELNAEMYAKMDEMRTQTQMQLNRYRTEWETAILRVKNGTVKEFDAMTADMPEIGRNIIKGLMEGLSDMSSDLTGQVKGIAEGIKNTIETALDIHSPSRWARYFVMGNLAKGFALGANDNKGMIAGASGRMAEWLKPDVNIKNAYRGFVPSIKGLTPSSAQTTSNTTSHTDQSQNVQAHFVINGSKNEGNDVRRAWREIAFKLGV